MGKAGGDFPKSDKRGHAGLQGQICHVWRCLSKSSETTPAQTRSIIENSYYSINEKDSSARLDENNVNADAEEVEMARAQLQYQYVLNAVNSDFSRLRSVIQGQ